MGHHTKDLEPPNTVNAESGLHNKGLTSYEQTYTLLSELSKTTLRLTMSATLR